MAVQNAGMELRHLRYFVAVAEEGGITRAAARLGIAQPPLSQQIARLERELGVRLLVRTSRGVRTTAAGAALLVEARRLLAEAQDVERVVRRVGEGESGAVRVGAVASAAYGTLVPALREFRRRHPGVLPLVHEMEATPQLEALARGTIDLGLLRVSTASAGVRLHPLSREPLVVALPHDHPLASRASVPLAALAGESFALFPRSDAPEAFDAIVGACTAAGFTPDVVYEAADDHALLALVASGLAVSLVPRGTTSLVVPEVTYRPVRPRSWAATLAVALPTKGAGVQATRLLDAVRAVDRH